MAIENSLAILFNGRADGNSEAFSFARNSPSIDGTAEAVGTNEPRYDISKGIASSVTATKTLAFANANINQGFGGVDADGITPLFVILNSNQSQVEIFRSNLTAPIRVFAGRASGDSWDMMEGAEVNVRYTPFSGTICHGLIVLECTRWNLSPSQRTGVAVIVSQDLGQTWEVIQDTNNNKTFPDFYVGSQRGAGFCLQNWYPEVEGSSLAVWFAFTDYLLRGTGADDANGGQTGLIRATRASVSDPWVVDRARLMFQYDTEEGVHFHSAFPIIDLNAGKIGVVTAVGDTVDRNFMCLSWMNISTPTDYKTATIVNNREFSGLQGTGAGVDYGKYGHQFTSAAPGPIRNSALVGSDFQEEVVALILPPDGDEDWSTAKAQIKRIYGNDRQTENFSVICKDPLTRTGYISGRQREGASLNELYYSEDGYHWDEVLFRGSSGASPYPHFFDNSIIDVDGVGLNTLDIPEMNARRPLQIGPGSINHVGAWGTWTAAPAGVTRVKVEPNADGLYEYPTGHALEGQLLPEQPVSLTEVWRITCTGASNNIGGLYLTATATGISSGVGAVAYGMFILDDGACLLNDVNSGYQTVLPVSNQNWIYKAYRNKVPPATGSPRRPTMMLLNRDGTDAKPLDILLTVISHNANGGTFSMGYPVPPLTDKTGVHEVANVAFTASTTWSIKAELGFELAASAGPSATTPLLTVREDADNYVTVFWSATDQLTLSVVADGGAAVEDTLSITSFREYPDRNFKLLISRLADDSTELRATSAGGAIVSTTVAEVIDGSGLTIKLGANVDASVVTPLRVFGTYVAQPQNDNERNEYLSRLEVITNSPTTAELLEAIEALDAKINSLASTLTMLQTEINKIPRALNAMNGGDDFSWNVVTDTPAKLTLRVQKET